MNNAITKRGVEITDMASLERFAKLVAATEFAPAAFKGKPQSVAIAIQYGMECGLSPMQALQSIAVINGKPSMYGDGLLALCLAHPDCEGIDEDFDKTTMTATCTVRRRGHKPYSYSFGKKDAEKAGLWGKRGRNGQDTPWITYPERMLQMRARGFALRDKFADALRGIITAEEARDYPVDVSVQSKSRTIEPFTRQPDPDPPQDYSPAVQEEYDPVSGEVIEESCGEQEMAGAFVLHFGKHKGKRLDECPSHYIKWLRDNATTDDVRNAVHAFLEPRDDARRDHVQQDVGDYPPSEDQWEPMDHDDDDFPF